jgi:hypothetical protein
MNKSRTLSAASLVSLLLVLAACSSEQQPSASPEGTDTPYAREMDKARAVEQTLQQQKDGMDRSLEEKENPTAE